MFDRFLKIFERFATPLERPFAGRPPAGGLNFIVHFARQIRGPFIAMLILGGVTALIESALFIFVGVIVDMMAATQPRDIFTQNALTLLLMALVVAVLRALIATATAVLEEQIVVPDFFTMVRWQSHQAVARQDVSFFDDQLSGRVSSKVWQGGNATGDVMISLLQIIWFIAVFSLTTLVVVAGLDWRMLAPILVWFAVWGLIAYTFVPRIRSEGRKLAEVTAVLTGRMVDGYSNIRTVKLYGAERANDAFVEQGFRDALVHLHRFTRVIAAMRISNQTFSSLMLVAIAATALWLYSSETLSAGEVAIVLALCLRLNLLLGRLLGLLNGLFRNFGTVQNSASMIAKEPAIVDRQDASKLSVDQGEVSFDSISFAYDNGQPVFDGLSLNIPAGQKVGIVGRSGVGKTTLVNLLLRFYDIDDGAVRIDDHDIAHVTQHSLRSNIGIITQEPSLLHRSIADNIAYGKEDASADAVRAAARQAQADMFIEGLVDAKNRKGYEAFVGERGVKLSGGQRQRIALARVFLKDAPILVLDEATSALDSEVEAAIQDNLGALMRGKTVIAIAHRLSTIAHLDRLIVLEDGKIVEDGDHASLLAKGGAYAALWNRQSGGFLPVAESA